MLSRDGIPQSRYVTATFYGVTPHSGMQDDGKRRRLFFQLFEDSRRSDAGEAHEASGAVIEHLEALIRSLMNGRSSNLHRPRFQSGRTGKTTLVGHGPEYQGLSLPKASFQTNC